MFLEYFILGFLVKIIASLDDAVTRIPVMAYITKTRMGRIAFSIGNILAVCLIIVIAFLLSVFISELAYAKYISAGLVFLLAIAIYFKVFKSKDIKAKKIDTNNHWWKEAFKLAGLGFLISFVTLIDDVVAMAPLFLDNAHKTYTILGILIATIVQIILIIYFAKQLDRIKYKREIASIGLVILSILIFFGIV